MSTHSERLPERVVLNLKQFKTGETFVIGVDNELIVVSCLAMTYYDERAFGFRKPEIVNIWLNKFGRTSTIFKNDYQGEVLDLYFQLLYLQNMPSGSVEYSG